MEVSGLLSSVELRPRLSANTLWKIMGNFNYVNPQKSQFRILRKRQTKCECTLGGPRVAVLYPAEKMEGRGGYGHM